MVLKLLGKINYFVHLGRGGGYQFDETMLKKYIQLV